MHIVIDSLIITLSWVYIYVLSRKLRSLETRIDAIEHLTDRIVDTTSHGEQS